MAQEVGLPTLNTEARVESHSGPRGICGGPSSTSVFLQQSFHQYTILTHLSPTLYNLKTDTVVR